MAKNLVIVESPAKAKTIEKFLGKEYQVMSSYGHIRDLKKRSFSVNETTFEPQYEIPNDKTHIVSQLRAAAKKSDIIWLASDEDREGEAIAWHLKEVLNLKPERTKRIVFHEITKNAILEAIEHPRSVDMSLVYAQQARRVLDRMVGFKLSPVLWRKVKPALSAGRVQSVAVRLVVEREREITTFKTEKFYRVTAQFTTTDGSQLKADLNKRFATQEEAKAFLAFVAKAKLSIEEIATRPTKRTPAAPFTTSTLQQEAAHKLGFPVSQTMSVAQKLYENGYITYMRTDSVNLSTLCLGACRKVITETMGEEYVNIHQYHTQTKGAQEAHEAIRPTYMDNTELTDVTLPERRLYDLIWKRTISSQMADARLEKTTVNIKIEGRDEQFVAIGEVCRFDGFMKIYRENDLYEDSEDKTSGLLPAMNIGDTLQYIDIKATERFTQHPSRYNEASLVRKLEELGIGRPSTYAPTISTIVQRGYVVKGDKDGEEKEYQILTLQDGKVETSIATISIGSERGRLLPTDTGIVVNDFLMESFPSILDYNFTAEVEKKFDSIAEGTEVWTEMIKAFWDIFDPMVEATINSRTELRAGERVLGNDPDTGKVVSVKIGRYGPIVQIGASEDEEKPRFAQLKKGQSMEAMTLEEALSLFQLPRTVGEFEGFPVVIGTGRYGNYISYLRKFISIPASVDPLTMPLKDAIALIQHQRQQEADRHLKSFEEYPSLEIMNGRYGPYICYEGNNYRLPKNLHAKAAELTVERCLEIIKTHKK